MEKKEEKVGELEILKNRFDELGRDIDKYINKVAKREERREERREKLVPKKEKSGYFKILIILIIILVVLDAISLIAYYKPNLSGFIKFNNSNSSNSSNSSISSNKSLATTKCSDGTLEETCSKTKPMYCYNGNLVKKAYDCGCPSGYSREFQDCVKQ